MLLLFNCRFLKGQFVVVVYMQVFKGSVCCCCLPADFFRLSLLLLLFTCRFLKGQFVVVVVVVVVDVDV